MHKVDDRVQPIARVLILLLIAAGATRAQTPGEPSAALALHVVTTPIQSYRLLSMSMDDDGFIWAGAIHRVMHRYDPRTGAVETIPLPFDAVVCSCICVGDKVYVLGQSYPRLVIYNDVAMRCYACATPVDSYAPGGAAEKEKDGSVVRHVPMAGAMG